MPHSTSPIPVGTRLLHIGPHRTGSTAVQTAFRLAQQDLDAQGVHYATGSRVRPALAGWALGLPGRPAGTPRPSMWAWNQLVKQVADSRADRVVVSNEDFSRATPELIERALGDLGGPERCRVVLVATRWDLSAPARWRERVKAGERRSYDEWLRVVLDRDDSQRTPERASFWRPLDLQPLISRWSEHLPASSIAVVVAAEAEAGPGRTLAGLEQLLGLRTDTLRAPSTPGPRDLTWAECETLRAINEAFAARGWSKPVRRRFVRRQILPGLRAAAPPVGPDAPPMPDWAAEELRKASDEQVELLAESPVQVVGDLDALRVPADLETVTGPYPVPELERRTVGEVVTSLVAATLAAEEAEAAAIDAEVDDEDVEDDGESME